MLRTHSECGRVCLVAEWWSLAIARCFRWQAKRPAGVGGIWPCVYSPLVSCQASCRHRQASGDEAAGRRSTPWYGGCEESSGDPGAQIMQVPYLSENSVVYCSGGVLRAGIARESYPRLMACSTKGTRGRSQTNVRPIYLRDILPAIGIAKRCYEKWRSPERCPNSSSRRRARGRDGGGRRRPMTPKFTAGQNDPIAQEEFHGMFVVY